MRVEAKHGGDLERFAVLEARVRLVLKAECVVLIPLLRWVEERCRLRSWQ